MNSFELCNLLGSLVSLLRYYVSYRKLLQFLVKFNAKKRRYFYSALVKSI